MGVKTSGYKAGATETNHSRGELVGWVRGGEERWTNQSR